MMRVASSDRSAQRALDARLRARSLRIARSLLRNEADATDACQNSMVEIFKSAASYRGESSLEHWADRIVARTSVRTLAARRAWQAPLETAVAIEELAAPSQEIEVSLVEYLERLSSPMRLVLLLKYSLEFSVDEIASVTGVSVNTVKDRLLRGKHAMRRLIRRERVLVDGWGES